MAGMDLDGVPDSSYNAPSQKGRDAAEGRGGQVHIPSGILLSSTAPLYRSGRRPLVLFQNPSEPRSQRFTPPFSRSLYLASIGRLLGDS